MIMSTEELVVNSVDSLTRGNIVDRLSSIVFELPTQWAERTDLAMIISPEAYELYLLNAMQKGFLAIEYNYMECCGIPVLPSAVLASHEVVIKVTNMLEEQEIDRLRTLGNKYVIVSEPVLQNSYCCHEHNDFSLPFAVSFLMDAILLSLLISII
jgi:hypothetical protein